MPEVQADMIIAALFVIASALNGDKCMQVLWMVVAVLWMMIAMVVAFNI